MCLVIFVTSFHDDDGSVNSAVIIEATVATLSLVLIFIIIIVIVVMCRRRMKSRRTCSINDRAIHQLSVLNTSVQSQHNYTNCNLSSQLRHQIYPTPRLEVVNALCIPTWLNSTACRTMMHLELMWNGCDVIITPNPSYAINPNSLQAGRKFNYQYDYT